MTLVLNREGMDAMWREFADQDVLGFDTETKGLDWWRDSMCGISIASPTFSAYLPFRHGEGPNLPLAWVAEVGEQLARRKALVTANGNFDFHVMRRDGWFKDQRLPPLFHDVQIAAYVVDENQRLKLEELAKTHLGIDGDAAEQELYGHLKVLLNIKGKKKVPKSAKGEMWRLPAEKVAPYAEADARHTRLLLDVLLPQVRAEGLGGVYRNLIEYQRVLHDMEEHGLYIDQQALEDADKNAIIQRDLLMKKILDDSGGRVKNPNSVPQLAEWLGTDSTSKKFLKKLEDQAKLESLDDSDESIWLHNLPPKIEMLRQYRQWDTATNKYYKKIRERLHESILHPQLRITGAKVRLSCGGGFNAQAIPRTKEEKPHAAYHGIKSCISAPPGRQLFEIDYSQAEIVMAAHYSQDPLLLKIIGEGLSLHDVTAEKNGCDRDAAKMQNFMVPYGAGAAKYAEERGIPLYKGKAELEAHYRTFPLWRELNFKAINEAQITKRIRLWSGRTRHFAGHEEKIRTALNVLIQGGVTECIREKTVEAWHKFPDLRFSLTVHDSNIGDMPIGAEKELWPEVRKVFTDFPWMNPCLDCEMKVGKSWATAKKVG